jgi:hypothetical protein
MAIAEQILKFLNGQDRQDPVCAKQLLHFGSRAAVDQALSRLAQQKKLMRVARGFYALPIKSRFGDLPPIPAEIIAAIARQKGERISSHGAVAANALGLTTQVPLRTVYLTSGRSRRIRVSGETIELRHAVPLAEDARHEQLLRAIEWLGVKRPQQVRAMLNSLSLRERRELVERAALMPDWMAEAVSLAAHRPSAQKGKGKSGPER